MAEPIQVDIYDRVPARIAAAKVNRDNCHDVARWLKENNLQAKVLFHMNRIEFFTDHKITVRFGDWVVRNAMGGFSVCKDPHFKKNYIKAMVDA